MKKQIFTLVGAILFSLTTLAQDYTGIWQAEEDTSYYVVILYNFEKGYIFTNFSFIEQNVVQENFMEKNENHIKTVVHNPDNGWRVFLEYEYIDKDNLRVTYSGDCDATHMLKRKVIVDN